MTLHFADDAIHRPHGLQWILPDRSLGGEHHGIGAVEDRVRHVRCFRARRARRVDHRFEHLGGGDDRFSLLIRFADQPLLHERHLLEGKLDPEIPARDHHRVRRRHDALEVIERRRLLDLGDELDRVGHEPPQLLDVLRPSHE